MTAGPLRIAKCLFESSVSAPIDPQARGLRIGTVRRPPRGVAKSECSSKNYYDVWLPALAPSSEAVKLAQNAKNEREWVRFVRKYRTEMASPENRATLDLLAALSRQTNFSVGCYCPDESRCHRSVLRALLSGARRNRDMKCCQQSF